MHIYDYICLCIYHAYLYMYVFMCIPCIFMYIYVYVHTMHIYVYICSCIYHAYFFIYVHVHTMYIYICVHVHPMHIYVIKCIFMYTCIFIYIYMDWKVLIKSFFLILLVYFIKSTTNVFTNRKIEKYASISADPRGERLGKLLSISHFLALS